eukprot:1634654-Pyramimonas_sp.AAC.1
MEYVLQSQSAAQLRGQQGTIDASWHSAAEKWALHVCEAAVYALQAWTQHGAPPPPDSDEERRPSRAPMARGARARQPAATTARAARSIGRKRPHSPSLTPAAR